jgi:perosamine synthetase
MIPVFKPALDQEEWLALKEPLEKGWLGLGPKTKEFEEKFAEYTCAPYAVGTNSGTSALHLGFALLDVTGGEVITTSLTYVATNHAILYCGGIPVFADIEDDTGNIRVDEIERSITPRTKAICVVHYGGHPCDMDPIMELAVGHNLPVLQDSAHACGSKYKGRPIGSFGPINTFSFDPVKNLATGAGGMVTLQD